MISLHSVLNVIVISISVIHIRAQIDEKFHYSTNNGGKFDGNTYVQFSEPPDEVPDYNVNEVRIYYCRSKEIWFYFFDALAF